MIVARFYNISITKEQAESLVVFEQDRCVNEVDIIESAKSLKLNAKLRKLNVDKIKDITAPIIAKDSNGEFFIIARSKDKDFMVLMPGDNAPKTMSRDELSKVWDGTAVIITQRLSI